MRAHARSALTVLLLSAVALWGADRHVGTWKMNPVKSKYTKDHPPFKSLILTVDEQTGGIVFDVKGEDTNGPLHFHFNAEFDGKDYPTTGSPDGSNTVSVNRVDDSTIEITNKKDGKVTTRIRSVVSADGKTRTSTWTGPASNGQQETWTVVFDKQ